MSLTLLKYQAMGFFDRFFGGANRDPIPKRPLRLQYTPSPETAPVFAQQFVDVVRNNDRFQLDYSIASIEFVDRFLQRFSDAGVSNDKFAETIFVAGAYVGQVMVLHLGARWIKASEIKTTVRQPMMPIVIALPNGSCTDPIYQAFRRYVNGQKENLQQYFTQN